MDSGKSVKDQLKESTQLSADILFKAGKFKTWQNSLWYVYRENLEEKNKNLIEKIKNVEKMYREQVQKAEEVFEKKENNREYDHERTHLNLQAIEAERGW